jgi:two-component system, cell cycle sensor histidine kinase and response regulator CckA
MTLQVASSSSIVSSISSSVSSGLARRALRSEARYRQLFEASPDALLVFDGEGRLLAANGNAGRLFGGGAGLRVRDLLPEGALSKGQSLERTLQTPRGQVEVELSAAACGGELLVCARDVTARNRLLRERRELEERLRRSQRLDTMGRLLGGVAHDLNTLMTVISANADELAEGQAEGPARDIHDASSRAKALLRQLLRFGRGATSERVPIDPNQVAQETARFLAPLLGKAWKVTLSLGAQVPWVNADSTQLMQVLFNLLLNARDAMPGGGAIGLCSRALTLQAPLEFHGIRLPPGSYSALSVQDAGTGIAPEVLARIFEPFFTTKDEEGGTGLGLASSLGIVKDCGGAVLVHPGEGGVGSLFQVLLPALE